jgi:predicted ribonuclease YlaK
LLDGIDLTSFSKVHLPITVLEELDSIKHKSEGERNYKARKAIRQIEEADNVEYKLDCSYSLPIWLDSKVPDNRILGFAKQIVTVHPNAILLSNDINVRAKAKALDIPCEKFEENNKEEIYKGFKEVTLDEYELATFYECKVNKWDLLNNEYLIIRDGNGDIVDKYKWTDDKGFVTISSKGFKSIYLGDFKPKDAYQMLALDSLNNMDFTLLSGMAGTGKTQLALSYIMQNLEKIGKVVIIFNPAKLKNSEQLGYYSGSRLEKLLQNSIGGILSSKLGSMSVVETLSTNGKFMLLPTSDIRGIEISEKDILYVTEAQNTDAYTMRTILQRAKEGCKIIIEGDMLEQRDLRNSTSNDNGMAKAIEAFKGSKYFSCVELQNTYRSPIAEIAQRI